jgi:mRNA interferase MazF
MVIRQGDIYWVDLGEPGGSGPGYRYPHVVIQNDLFNQSAISTVIVCALTSNLQRSESPGNLLLRPGESKLPKQSVVNVSQVFTVDKAQLGEKIGTLSANRVRRILDGVRLFTEPRSLGSTPRP